MFPVTLNECQFRRSEPTFGLCVVFVCSFSALLTGVCLPNAAPTFETAKQSYFDVGPWKRAVFERKVWSEWKAHLRSTPRVLCSSSLESLKRKKRLG